jgi:catechol 2,3-dioxygenase-like lactoylglutathione lyase family enzyme
MQTPPPPSSPPASLPALLRRIDRVVLRLPSLAAGVKFYTETMGLHLVHQSTHFATLRCPDGKNELVIHDDPDQPAEAVYWLVDNVKEIYARRAELKLAFLSPPQQAARGFRAAVKDPFGTVLLLIDRSSDSHGVVEDAKAPGELFAGVEPRVAPKRDLLVKLYQKLGRTADDLPYTPHFESLYGPYAEAHPDPKPSRAETWRHLLNLRKGGKLPKLGEAKSRPPTVTPEELASLKLLMGPDLGRRDRLPYTEQFDKLVDEFNRKLPRKLSPHLVWRLVATMAK